MENEGPRYLKDRKGYFPKDQRQRTRKRSREMEASVSSDLKKQRNRPGKMAYFDEVLKYGGMRFEELREFHKKGGKIVGTLCVMVPLELVNAAGARSVRMCSGYYEPVHPANELLGDAGLCPMVKSTLGRKMVSSDPLIDLIDLVAGPATCDGKMKLAEILEDWVPVVMMNIPRVKVGETSSDLWVKEIVHLKDRLEELTGHPVRKKALKEELSQWNEANQYWSEIQKLRRSERPPISGRDAMLVVQASQFDDIRRWNRKVKELIEELQRMRTKGIFAGEEGAARILLAGSPMIYPNFKIPSIIEGSGGTIVTDELCSGYRLMSDPVLVDGLSKKEIYQAIAERYFFPCSCPCFSPNDERVRRLKEVIKAFGIEGVVFHTLRGCHLNNLEATKIELALREISVPMVRIESEYDEGDIEQVRTRIEAFVEMIKARREYHRNPILEDVQ
ncbi:MAG: 2-hydroxyacyl-CoA dehydratase [Candidatus Thermoplasmatota archaeon]|nr:2-hydroxyacyl-CoA dehydratase [Candidatus Thermoplasmatota archaeon]